MRYRARRHPAPRRPDIDCDAPVHRRARQGCGRPLCGPGLTSLVKCGRCTHDHASRSDRRRSVGVARTCGLLRIAPVDSSSTPGWPSAVRIHYPFSPGLHQEEDEPPEFGHFRPFRLARNSEVSLFFRCAVLCGGREVVTATSRGQKAIRSSLVSPRRQTAVM